MTLERRATSVRSVLLCAGQGKRLRPLTESVAKPALRLLDVPLGSFGLAALVGTAPPVVVNVSHLPETITGAFEGVVPSANGWEVSVEPTPAFGTGGTLASLADRVAETVVVHNGDLASTIAIEDLIRAHRRSARGGTLVARPVERGADLEVEGDRVVSFVDRRTSDVAGWMYLGVSAISRAAVAEIPDRKPLGLGESVFAPMATRGELRVHPHRGYAIDVGTPERFMEASLDLLHDRGPRSPIPFPGDFVDVGGGRAYVGVGARVDEASLGPDSIVLAGATVASGATLRRAIVWPGEHVPPGVDLVDSIWFDGADVSLAPS